MLSSTDHLTGATGANPTVTIRKPGGAFASPAGAVSEIGNGWYEVAANATDNNTLGPLLLHATGTGADPCDDCFQVVFNAITSILDVKLADAVAHGGSTATLQLGSTTGTALTIGCSANNVNAVSITQTGSSKFNTGHAVNIATSNGTASGISISAPSGGNGILVSPKITSPITGNITGSISSVLAVSTGAITSTSFLNDSGLVPAISQSINPAGITTTTVTFNSGASTVNDFYKDMLIQLTSGTDGSGNSAANQARRITAYNGTTRIATIDRAWDVVPTTSFTCVVTAMTATRVGVLDNDSITANTIATSAITEIANGIFASGNMDGFSLEETLKLCLAALAGKLSGATGAATTIVIRAADDSKDRITADVDTNGNRTTVTLDVS